MPITRTSSHEAEDEDIYDDAPPPRRRIGVVAIAAVFALAVVGTAGAFGYRALFGSSGTRVPPPVIKADNTPMQGRAFGREQGPAVEQDDHRPRRRPPGARKLVSREEQPIENRRPADGAGPERAQSSPLAPANGSGVVTSEPKKIHTITIRPDQVGMADTGASAADAGGAAAGPGADPGAGPARRDSAADAGAAASAGAAAGGNVPPVVAETNPEPVPREPRPAVARAASPAPPPPSRASHGRSNAPLSLNPDAAPARVQRPGARRGTGGAPPLRHGLRRQPSSGGGYAVQVSAQRSEAEAQAAFRSMQAKYPDPARQS